MDQKAVRIRAAKAAETASALSTTREIEQLSVILSQPPSTRFYTTKMAERSSSGDVLAATVEASPEMGPLIVSSPQSWALSSEQVRLVLALCQRSDTQGRERIVRYLDDMIAGVLPHSAFGRHRALAFIALANQGFFLRAFYALLAEAVDGDRFAGTGVEGMAEFLKYQHDQLSDAELTEGRNLLSQCIGGLIPSKPLGQGQGWWKRVDRLRGLISQIRKIEYERLRGELLEGHENLEVNRDKQTLVSNLQQMGFPNDLCRLLEDVETEYRKPPSQFQFKRCAEGNRSFLEHLLIEVNRSAGGSDGEPKAVREALKKIGLISSPLQRLITEFYGYLSSEATHSLSATAEVARLARNMNIEIGLLLLRQLERWQTEQATQHPAKK